MEVSKEKDAVLKDDCQHLSFPDSKQEGVQSSVNPFTAACKLAPGFGKLYPITRL